MAFALTCTTTEATTMNEFRRMKNALMGMGITVPDSAKTIGDLCLIMESQGDAAATDANGNPDDDAEELPAVNMSSFDPGAPPRSTREVLAYQRQLARQHSVGVKAAARDMEAASKRVSGS